jgi:hypothetical protein
LGNSPSELHLLPDPFLPKFVRWVCAERHRARTVNPSLSALDRVVAGLELLVQVRLGIHINEGHL